MADVFTETIKTSWFQRIGKSFKGIIIGFLLFIIAFPVLFWNEGRTIHRTHALKQTEANHVDVKCDVIDQANEGKPVHMTGDANTEEVLKDDVFPVSVIGFKLQRKVEMYQWVEKEDSDSQTTLGGGEETNKTITYETQWCDHYIDSSSFEHPEGHKNPEWEIDNNEFVVNTGKIGAFTLSESIINKIDWYKPLPVEAPTTSVEPAEQPLATPADAESLTKPEIPALPVTPANDDLPTLPALPANNETPALPETSTGDELPELPSLPEMPAGDEVTPLSDTTSDVTPIEASTAPAANADSAVTQTTSPSDPAAGTALAQTPEAIAAANGVPEGFIYFNGGFHKGDPKNPEIGDVRVTFEYIPSPQKISLISCQQGDSFAPYHAKGGDVELVDKGDVSAKEMFIRAHKQNSLICWVLRLVGFLMMLFGLKMVFEPLRVIADVVPFIGSIVGMGIGFVAFVLAAGFSLLTIAIGWVFYRPLIGIPLLIAALIFLLMPFFKGKKAAATAQPAAPFEKQ